MTVEVLNINGKSTGRSISLPEEIFGIEPNAHTVYLAVKQYQAAQRQGTHKSKERNEVARSTKKIKRQKGTGTARAGSMKNPTFKGGGRIFGPKPRNYSFKLNKKVKQVAKASAFSDKALNGGILVVEDFNFEKPTTKGYIQFLSSLSLSGRTLHLTNGHNANVYLSSRNLPKAEVLNATDVNTYEIVKADCVILSEGAVQQMSNPDNQ